MTTERIQYCANGCTIRSGDTKVRARTQVPSLICSRCEDNLTRWLREIPDNYSLLPTFIEPGSTESNPDSKSTKNPFVPPAVRLEVLDLLDSRHGRVWNGTAPAHDRRGAIGTIFVHLERLAHERPLTVGPTKLSVSGACDLLARHRVWIAEQDWVILLFEDLKLLNRQLADAVGDYRRPPVGRCPVTSEDADKPCGGGLYASDYGGVRCGRCGSVWDVDRLRHLGRVQAEAQATSA